MINKFNTLCLVWLLGYTSIVLAKNPPSMPELYSTGPSSALLSTTKLGTVEKTFHALYEATMDVAKELIHATSCSAAAGKYTFIATVNGTIADTKNNEIKVLSAEKANTPFILRAEIGAPSELRGQPIKIERFGKNSLGSAEITKFESTILFNMENSIMTAENRTELRGLNGANHDLQSATIKNLYLDADADTHHVYSWGLQSFSKLGFPVEIYWLRSKTYRNDGIVERTIFTNDRIAGPSPCRILLESLNNDNKNTISQTGSMVISTEPPDSSPPDFNLKPS